MKMKNILLSAVAASTIFAFGSQTNNASANSKIIPKAYRGTWYMYTKPYYDKTIVHNNKIVFQTVKSKNLSKPISGTYTLKPGKRGGKESKYFGFDSSKSFTDGLAIWTKKMKIDGKYQKVLIQYERMGSYAVFTKHPVKHNYSYVKNGAIEYGK